MPAFVRLELWDRLQCQSGATLLGTLAPDALASAGDVLSLTDQESLSFAFSRVNRMGEARAIVSAIRGQLIMLVRWDDASFDEWRVSTVQDSAGTDGLVSVTCMPMIHDLAARADSFNGGGGLVSQLLGSERVFDFTAVGDTPATLWSTYIMPSCPIWVQPGTIDPTFAIPSLTWTRLTPLALATQIQQAVNAAGIPCELRLRRNGTSNYLLDLVTAVGAGASVPLFHPRAALTTLTRKFDTTEQATRVFPVGGNGPDGLPGIPGRARWQIVSYSFFTRTFVLQDPNGGSGPVAFDGQWVGGYVVFEKSGATSQVTDSLAVAQSVTFADAFLEAPTAGDFVQFRLSEPHTNTRALATPNPRYAIASIFSANVFNIAANQPPLLFPGVLDWYARVWTASSGGSIVATLRIAGTGFSAGAVDTYLPNTGVTTSHFVEFVQLDGAGEIASYVDHPTLIHAPPTGYGMQAAALPLADAQGVAQLCTNGWLRNWGGTLPDGWTMPATPVGSLAKNTNPLFTRYGGNSLFASWLASSNNQELVSPPIAVVTAPDNSIISVRAQVLFATVSSTSVGVFRMRVMALSADGSVDLTATELASTTVVNPALNAWVTVEIIGIDLGANTAPYGVCLVFDGSPTGGVSGTTAYLDTAEVYQYATNPVSLADSSSPAVYEFGDAHVLYEAANSYLATNGAPLVAYTIAALDLEREDPVAWARNALTLGGSVRAVDAEIGVDATVRLLRLQRDFLNPMASVLGLANSRRLLSQLVALT